MKAVLLSIAMACLCYGQDANQPDPCDPCDPCKVSQKTIKLGSEVDYTRRDKDATIVKMRTEIEALKAQIAALQTENDLLKRKCAQGDESKNSPRQPGPGSVTVPVTGETIMATTPVLGIYLGETIEALKERMKLQPFRLPRNEYGIARVETYKFRTDSPEFPEGTVYVYENKVFRVTANLKAKAKNDIEIMARNIVANLNVKYGDTTGKSTDDVNATGFSTKTVKIGGVDANLTFEKYIINYSHNQICKKMLEDSQNIKAGQVKSGL